MRTRLPSLPSPAVLLQSKHTHSFFMTIMSSACVILGQKHANTHTHTHMYRGILTFMSLNVFDQYDKIKDKRNSRKDQNKYWEKAKFTQEVSDRCFSSTMVQISSPYILPCVSLSPWSFSTNNHVLTVWLF